MGVGPPGRTGRDQLEGVRAFLADPARRPGEVVAIACDHGAGRVAAELAEEGAVVYPVDCAGNLHTSVVELLVRGGASGVLVLPCPARDCRNREGPRWLVQRMFEGREAELQDRVDRRRVRAWIPWAVISFATVFSEHSYPRAFSSAVIRGLP